MAQQSPLATVILAAGKGTRMKSPKAKVLHEVFFQPMVHHVLRAAERLAPEKAIVIVGHQKEEVEKALAGFGVICVEQAEQNGTGHAVLCAEEMLADFSGNVMILCGDSPLLLSSHLQEMRELHENSDTVLTIITTTLANPANYGRIIADAAGNVLEIVEEKDATEEQRRITEINAGIYCVEKEFLFQALKQITTDNSQGEMYLTDIIAIAVRMGHKGAKISTSLPQSRPWRQFTRGTGSGACGDPGPQEQGIDVTWHHHAQPGNNLGRGRSSAQPSMHPDPEHNDFRNHPYRGRLYNRPECGHQERNNWQRGEHRRQLGTGRLHDSRRSDGCAGKHCHRLTPAPSQEYPPRFQINYWQAHLIWLSWQSATSARFGSGCRAATGPAV